MAGQGSATRTAERAPAGPRSRRNAPNKGKARFSWDSRLAIRRGELRLTLEQVGERANLPFTTVSAYERGRSRRPDPAKWARYATALGLTPEEARAMAPRWPVTPWGGDPFARHGRGRTSRNSVEVRVAHALAYRASRVCARDDRDIEQLVHDALERELARIEAER